MVRATFAGLSTALSALQANQKRLDIVGQNLSNMNTVGYTRQQLETSSLNYTNPVAHYMNGSEIAVGFGVHMDKVSQIRDPFLDIQYRTQMKKAGYAESLQNSLDVLARPFDESNIDGVRTAIDDIQVILNDMQDLDKFHDPVYESNLRSRMSALTNLINDAARQVEAAEKEEFAKLDGKGTSENGAIDTVNNILQQIGDLNRQIKQNQILGQQSLELMDERNNLLDSLASYIPIEVTYFKDSDHDGFEADGTTEAPKEIYEYDHYGNIIGKKDWPDDLKVELLYTDTNGDPQRLTLVNGTEGKRGENYGSLSIDGGSQDDPLKASVKFTAAQSSGAASVSASASGVQLSGGSIQASLDMLGKKGDGLPIQGTQTVDDVRGYQYYMNRLDTLAKTFADKINAINNKNDIAGSTQPVGGNLLANKQTNNTGDITALTIGISKDWIDGTAHINDLRENPTDTILDMLEAMRTTHSELGNRTFADDMNNISTVLANDSSFNTNTLKTDVTVLNGIQNSRDSISGVSLDEEGANMMAYVSAYNAASRLMTALDEVLNTLINNTGVVGR
ncbi:flagellar basal body protein [Lachnospiraceae bacterium 45-P1]